MKLIPCYVFFNKRIKSLENSAVYVSNEHYCKSMLKSTTGFITVN